MAKKEVTIMYDLSDFKDFKRQCERVRTNTDIVVMTNPIREYDINGKFIKLWPNLKSLAESKGLSYARLRTHLRTGKPLTFNNRIYLKDKDDVKERLAILQMEAEKKALVEYAKKSQQIHVYTSDGSFVGIYNSLKEASKHTKINRSNIYNCIVGKAFVTGGYIFLTPFESIEDRLEKIKNRKTWKTNL
jgi:hypothetical protein